MSADASSAFQRFVDALNHPRDAAALSAAVAGDVRIDRHGPGVAVVAETFTGIAEVAQWLARTPPVATFALAGEPSAEPGETWRIEYAIRAGEFHNGGIWIARLTADGRIVFLSHHPFALRSGP